jgi:hypothetical protein
MGTSPAASCTIVQLDAWRPCYALCASPPYTSQEGAGDCCSSLLVLDVTLCHYKRCVCLPVTVKDAINAHACIAALRAI